MSKPRSGFWKNVVTVLAGSTGAQAVPLLVAPLLTRMCTPAEMGAFSVWLGVIAVASIIATLRLEAAMVLDHGKEQQRLCFGVVAYSATLLALMMTVFTVAARALGLPAVCGMSWFELLTIGLGTWLTASMQATLAYAASHNLFGRAAKAKVLQAGTIALAQVVLLFTGLNSTALMAGQLIGLGSGLLAARLLLAPPRPRIMLSLDEEQRAYLVKHQAFWRFSLPSSLLNTLVGQLPLFMIGFHHGVLEAGLFALAQRVISAPTALIAVSVLDVFKREAVHEFEAVGNCRDIYRATFKALLALALGPALVLLLFAPPLFEWIFGAGWRPAGELARLLAPLCFLNFIASPLSYVFFIAGKQKVELVWQVVLFVMTLGVFLAPLSLHDSLYAYTIGRSLLYLVYLFMSHQCSLPRRAAA
ncbi:lipopolysaccharide biosynthesis protein [Telluria aromaticivorans]|uniref:Lipopolysaccharide biosynthesis protein n=1 Tax=Telluria aromaticivorans TaxID=2725995 RepID=A0A7Y2NZ80_9BURK|nr:lipopolysaccharide biosynthesis protein [Telluria aromaticivorans]NNG21539.1 lipopolysaccharide biosynthesis protein [Telluria aromaticivorans]